MTVYPLRAVRALALHAQGLNAPYPVPPSPGGQNKPSRDDIFKIVDKLGCVQIDTIHVIARAQYLTIWSRLGTYDPDDFDALAYDPDDRRIFEGWQHAACFIPTHEYRFQMPHQRSMREEPSDWYSRWLSQLGHPETIAFVKERVQREGALKVSDFERGDHRGGTWWNWRPAKVGLEFLYAFGDFMITKREKFQRVYDLTERVLPAWVERKEPISIERDRFWIERGVKTLGVCAPGHAADYAWMKRTKGAPIVDELVNKGRLIEINASLMDDKTHRLLIHRDNLALLQQAVDGVIKAERTTFINPFDNLFWARGRDKAFWGFTKTFEAYLPASKRRHGYYSLNILHKDRLVGRFDPKLERKTRSMIIRTIRLEEGVSPDEELLPQIAHAMGDFLAFHGAQNVVIENSTPRNLKSKLMNAL